MPDPGAGPPTPDRGRGPRRPPPWWPETEPFPPRGPGGWGGRRPRFPRRVAIAFALLFGLAFVASAFALRLLSGGYGGPGGPRGGPPLIPLPVLGLAVLVAVLVAGRAVRRMAAPIGDVMEAADRVAGGDYTARVQARGPSEVRQLAGSFNQMAARLQANEAQRRSLLSDVTHELRTPLSVIRGNVEGMLDGVYPADEAHLRPVIEETAVMARLLDDLQTLSTAEAGVLRLYRERVDPASLVEDVVAAFRVRADTAGVALDWRATPGLRELDVDPVRIGEVLANLLSNAVRYTPRGGSVEVTAEPRVAGVSFTVSDTGPGIDARDLPHVFDRFVKSADSGGAGLGLAIAKSLVEAHGGEISAERRPGGGTTMRVVLPERDGSTSPAT
jgi:signal transduction histidine kinase